MAYQARRPVLRLSREAVIQLLAENGPLTRAELARRIGVSRAAVSMTVTRLIRDGLVVERTEAVARDQGVLGVPLTLNPLAGGAVGVDFAHQSLRVVIADLAHRVLAEDSRELGLDHDAREAMDLAAALVGELLARSGLQASAVLGVGVGVPGAVDRRTGCPTPSSISPSWVGLDVASEFSERVSMPVLVDNNANLGALAEVVWGAARDFTDVIYVKVGPGVGGGVVLGGQLWRGATGMSGELGHMTVDETGPMCRCGNRGCLEVYVGLWAQLRALRPVLGEQLDQAGLLARARSGDRRCLRLLADVGTILGKALANVCNIINPEAIVLGGEFASAFEFVSGPVREAIDTYALHLAATSVEVVASQLGERAEALGAVALVFHEGVGLGMPADLAVRVAAK